MNISGRNRAFPLVLPSSASSVFPLFSGGASTAPASLKRQIWFVDEMKKTHDRGRNTLSYRRTEIMVCVGGTCSASSFSSCLLFHLTAKIKAYNQILLIGPDGGDWPRVSPLSPSLPRPHSAENDNESWEAGGPASQHSGLSQSTLPADSQLVVILSMGRRPDLAIPSPPPRRLLLPPIDHSG